MSLLQLQDADPPVVEAAWVAVAFRDWETCSAAVLSPACVQETCCAAGGSEAGKYCLRESRNVTQRSG